MKSLPDRNNPYSFEEFLAWRDEFDFLEDDHFLKKVIRHYAGDLSADAEADLKRTAQKLSRCWVHLADSAGRAENAPYMLHFDGYNRRVDRIVRPGETLQLEKEVFEEAMFSERVDPWVRFIKIFLLCQLGESGVNCAHCCTAGLIMILEQFADTPELQRILRHLKEGEDGDFAIGSQFLSEVQGGSDVQANKVEAVPTEEGWRIYGTKFYCSAAHADYAVITAKPTGSTDVGVFVVPSWLPGDKAREKRNSYVINKLKSKLGTRELPTAEITYEGSVAYPVGELKRGLANIVGIVLAHSRFVTGLGGAAQILRVAREAKRYSEWRTAFGVRIDSFGLVARQVAMLEVSAKRSTAAAFKLQREILTLEQGSRKASENGIEDEKRRFQVRMLIMLQKLVACDDSAKLTETAMSIFGGHGLMEDFSSLPRLFRDAVVLAGAWEGPRNLLLTRIFMDLQRAARWYDTDQFVRDLLPGADPGSVAELADESTDLLAHDSLLGTDRETLEVCERWDRFCSDFFHAYQDEAAAEVASSPVL